MLNSRFYFFEVDNYNYCFDGQTLNIFVVSKYLKDLLNSNKIAEVKKYYKDIYTNILKIYFFIYYITRFFFCDIMV